jgi:signal transduction histidine kinase
MKEYLTHPTIAKWLSRLTGHLSLSHDHSIDEEQYICTLNLYAVRLLLIMILCNVLLFAPFDPWYLRHTPHKLMVLSIWRVAFGIVVFLCWRWSFRHPVAYYKVHHWMGMAAMQFAICCAFMVWFGSITEPRFYGTLFLPIASSLLLTKLKARLLGNLLVLMTGALVIAALDPQQFQAPFVAILGGYFVVSTAIAVAWGDTYTRKVLQNFQFSRSLQQNNASLEQRIAQKTQEATTILIDTEVQQERMRRTLSRELHDELGHQITLHNISLHHFLAAHRDDPERSAVGQQWLQQLQDIESGVRRVIHELRDKLSFEDASSFASALEDWAASFSFRHNLALEVLVEPEELALGDRTSFLLARLIQEVTQSIRDHARASKAEICLLQEGNGIQLSIRDNGSHNEHYEHTHLKERMSMLDGTHSLDHKPGKGTEFVMMIHSIPEGYTITST